MTVDQVTTLVATVASLVVAVTTLIKVLPLKRVQAAQGSKIDAIHAEVVGAPVTVSDTVPPAPMGTP